MDQNQLRSLLDQVRDGWCMVLDDDDQLLRPNSLAILEPYMTDPDRLIISRFRFNGVPYPREAHWGRDLYEGDVHSACVVFHSRHKQLARWLGVYGGDYWAFSNLAKELPVLWVDSLIAGVQRHDGRDGKGTDEDRIYHHWEPSCC